MRFDVTEHLYRGQTLSPTAYKSFCLDTFIIPIELKKLLSILLCVKCTRHAGFRDEPYKSCGAAAGRRFAANTRRKSFPGFFFLFFFFHFHLIFPKTPSLPPPPSHRPVFLLRSHTAVTAIPLSLVITISVIADPGPVKSFPQYGSHTTGWRRGWRTTSPEMDVRLNLSGKPLFINRPAFSSTAKWEGAMEAGVFERDKRRTRIPDTKPSTRLFIAAGPTSFVFFD